MAGPPVPNGTSYSVHKMAPAFSVVTFVLNEEACAISKTQNYGYCYAGSYKAREITLELSHRIVCPLKADTECHI